MQSMRNGLRVLEVLAVRQPAGVSSLARELDLPKSTVQRCLLTLEEAGWIQPASEGDTRWMLTSRALAVGRHVSPELGLREAALPHMHTLAEQTGETVYLAVREGYSTVLVERLDSTQALRTYLPLGAPGPLHGPSTGKAILAALPDAEIDAYLDRGIERYTKSTKTPSALRRDVKQIRETGYAVNMGEWRHEVAGIGAAIRSRLGHPVAAISISLPMVRLALHDVPAVGARIVEAVHSVEQQLDGDA